MVFKIIFDKFFALILLIFLSPLFILISLLIYISIGKPIFFTQSRAGYKKKTFQIYKFRTMSNNTDILGNLLPDDQRLYRIGRVIRSTSLDELPQLWNIITGDMSFVGPRPLLIEYLPLYNNFQIRRHEVLPGITGWAQINGRNSISWEEKFKYDIWYVNNRTFWLDMKILWITFLKVLTRSDIGSQTNVTMERFKGNNHAKTL